MLQREQGKGGHVQDEKKVQDEIGEFYQTYKGELMPTSFKLFQKTEEKGTLQTHSVRPALL